MADELETSPHRNSVRGGWGMRTVSAAMLVGGVVAAFGYQVSDVELPAKTAIAEKKAGSSAAAAPTTTVVDTEEAAFNGAKQGNCLSWDIAPDTTISNFHLVGCNEPHMFEVAERFELTDAEAWVGQFGAQASYPTQDALAQLQTNVCQSAVTKYLNGKYDPNGRLISAPIIPSRGQWADGNRTALCGIQATEPDGKTTLLNMPAAKEDQSRVFPPNACVTLDAAGRFQPVDCAEPHQMESTGTVNLAEDFGDRVPTDQEQNDVLAQKCVTMAQDYLGGDDALYYSTLVPFWVSLTPEALNAGSRTVNCWLVKDNGSGGFSTLAGEAKGDFTIDGAPKVTPPPRNPLREDVAGTPPNGTPNNGAPNGTPNGAPAPADGTANDPANGVPN